MYSECSQGRLAALVRSDVVDDMDDGMGHGEELVFSQALLDNVAQDLQRAVQLDIVALGYNLEEGRKEGGPFVGKVVVCNLANCVTAPCYRRWTAPRVSSVVGSPT